MNTYEVVLCCPCCREELLLGVVQADVPFEAKDKAVILWPDARASEMVFRLRKQQESCSAFPVEQEVA